MKLISEWKSCWKWFSMHCMVLAGAVQGAWSIIPDDLRATIPQHWASGLTIGLLILGVGGRLVDQNAGNT